MKRDHRFSLITKHTKICSELLIQNDFMVEKKDAVPSVFHWTREKSKQEETKDLVLI